MTKATQLALSEILEKKNTDVLQEIDGNVPVNARQVRENFSKIVKAAESDKYKIIVTDHGEPKAVIVSLDDLRIINWLEKQNIKDQIKGLAFRDVNVEELLAMLQEGVE